MIRPLLWHHRRAFLRSAVISLVALFASVIPSLGGSTGGSIVLRIKSSATVNAEVIRLRDVAVAAGDALEAKSPLWRTVVAKSPQPADSRRISRDHIRLRLKQLRLDSAGIVLRGAETVSVRRDFIEISKDRLRGMAVDFLNQQSFGPNTRMKIKQVQIRDSLLLPKGEVTYKVRSPQHAPTSGLIRLWIHFFVDRRPAQKLQVTAKVALYRKAVVAERIIGRYKPITSEDVSVKVVDISGEGQGVVSDIDSVLGQRSRRTIYPGTLIESGMIEFPPVVKRGDLVMIVAQSNGLHVSALGEVKKQGRPGDRIKVVNLDSRKAVYARVVDSETVQVDF